MSEEKLMNEGIRTNLDKICTGIAASNELVKTHSDNISEIKGNVKEVADDVTKAMEANTALQAKLDAQTKRADALEKWMHSVGANSQAESQEFVVKYTEQLGRYLRDGKTAIDADLDAKAAVMIVDDMCKGLQPKTRAKLIADMTHACKYSSGAAVDHKDLISGSNPDGGYWIIPQRISKIVDRVFETSPMMQIASVISTTTSSVELIIDDDEAAIQGSTGETTAPTPQATPQIGLLTIRVHTVRGGEHLISQELIDDAGFDVEGWLMRKIADKIARFINTNTITGDGAQKPRGILTFPDYAAPGVYERGAVEQIISEAATTFTYDGLVRLQNAVKDRYQAAARFLMKRVSFADILLIKDLDGRPLINPNQLAVTPSRVILGTQVLFFDDFPAVAADALAAAYGNFDFGYTIVNRIGLRVLRDPFTNKPFITITSDQRMGGDVTNFESFKLQRITT